MTNRISYILLAATMLLCGCTKRVHAQVPVAIAPNPHPQFLDASGKPLASGFLYTYQAGTTTFLATYADSSGTVQNPAIIPLDVSGAPSNGSVQTGIWLANTAYKFCAYNAALVQQWCTDNITGYLALLNTANLWTFQQTFSLPIIDTATDNQLVFGSLGNQTTLDFPPPTGNVGLHMPNTNDTMVGRATTDTMTNKTLISPAINTPIVNGCGITNGPGVYICVANANPTGTVLNGLTKFINSPSQATAAATTDTGGLKGICVAGCGSTGTATIQQSGIVPCVFDGATVANDYVQNSATVGDNCHDIGASYPASGQVLGQVLSTNAAAGTFAINLFGPEIRAFVPPIQESAMSAPSATLGSLEVLSPFYFFNNGHTLTRIFVHLTTQAAGCSTAAVVSLKNEAFNTILSSVTISNGVASVDSGPLVATMTTSTAWGLEVTTAPVGCGTVPIGFVSATYQ